MREKILIIEDDISLLRGITLALENEYDIIQASKLKDAREMIDKQLFDLIILDVNLPDGNGIDFLDEIQSKTKSKIIILTANDLETDIVTGLSMGANDYVTKPFSLMVLRARIEAQLRTSTLSRIYRTKDIELDFSNMKFIKASKLIELSKTEQRLLFMLIENNGFCITREILIDKLWDCDMEYVDNNALSVVINRLRAKLETDPKNPDHIITVYSQGYKWVN